MSPPARRSAAGARPGRGLTLRFKKHPDGMASLTCIRDDGSTTWQRQQGPTARFFPRHDLTHYAVETVLGLHTGFYGMVADGWDISDFGTPWPRGPLPAGGDLAEVIVGMLDLERAAGARYPAEEYREKVDAYYAARGRAGNLAPTALQLDEIRALRDELFARLDATRPGDTLELAFDQANGPR